MNRRKLFLLALVAIGWITIVCCSLPENDGQTAAYLKKAFLNPPESARPGVYWYFMDGNMSKEAMTKDLESMKKVGIGNLVFLEVNVGIPRGPVDFLSDEWQDLFKHAVREAERLGIAITLGVGPGWSGSGGPWVSGKESMQHLVSGSIQVSENDKEKIVLPKPDPKKPYFGEGGFTPELRKRWIDYYEDVAVLAFPTPSGNFKIEDIDEKALYYREPYTSKVGVKQFLPSRANYVEPVKGTAISQDQIIDITRFLAPDGTLNWKVPEGNWTIMRLGNRNNGAVTRPAPMPGLGFEADKMDTTAINAHLANFTGKLFQKIGVPDKNLQGGLKMLHMDSWEMGAQNWTPRFREEFKKRRGYDPLPYYPVYSGLVVESLEKSERFLWDLRQTAQELVIENHAIHLKKYGQKYNLGFSIEPYDMNPTADMELGAVADVPMCEFWSKGYGFNSSFSCIQAASIAHVNGQPVVAAEAFTAHKEDWKQNPGSMKNQGDWAFAAGINRFVYHTFQHQYLNDDLKPGMTMGPYGVHWDRSQTWWPMADGYHRYITRCSYILRQGRTEADILYLTPEGAPHVFRAPATSLTEDPILPDRKGYNFDGCSPSQLLTASVNDNQIVFPGGASYRILVMPDVETMTPALLDKIESLVKAGAVIVGNPPRKSPSLVNYPECDNQVAAIAQSVWGAFNPPAEVSEIQVGKGKILWGGAFSNIKLPELYPNYDATAELLKKMGVEQDFVSTGPVRYTHRTQTDLDIYFVSNKTKETVNSRCTFRASKGTPELWDPLTGDIRALPDYKMQKGRMQIMLQFESYQSYFIVFSKGKKKQSGAKNFSKPEIFMEVKSPWNVSFDPKWGGPKNVIFTQLDDWIRRPEDGIKYYSGIAVYHNSIQLPEKFVSDKNSELFLDLGEVFNLARIWVNGKDMGVVWTPPFRLKISDALIAGNNLIEIEVANLWPNRLIGDENFPDDGIKNHKWPDWLINNQSRTSGRYTFTMAKFYEKDSELLKSGLIGPVRILIKEK
ncbi:MAG: glycosyl hydrolase [Bacteroidota bacterium]|nr:glycosyl hydrolase [Bacteroidota bacterium]